MTNILVALVITTTVTNWVTVGDKEVGILVEKRNIVVEDEGVIALKDKILEQPLIRNPPPPPQIELFYTNYWTPTNLFPRYYWNTNWIITNFIGAPMITNTFPGWKSNFNNIAHE